MSSNASVWRPPPVVRPIAIGLVRRADQILVMAVRDDSGTIIGWRPPGGAIEFGERAAAALQREFVEELGEPVAAPRLVAVMENLYVHGEAPGHEIVFVFETAFAHPDAGRPERFEFHDGGVLNSVEWVDIESFRTGAQRLFPDDLVGHLVPVAGKTSGE